MIHILDPHFAHHFNSLSSNVYLSFQHCALLHCSHIMHAMYRFNPFHHHFSFCKAKKDWSASVASLALTRRKQFFEKIYMTVIQQAVIVKNERCCLFIHMRSIVKIKI